jgi:dienelactone hydrolase
MTSHPGERATFASDGLDLCAYVYRPTGRGPHPVVVVNHGSGLDQDSKPGVAHVLSGAGCLVVVPHRRGYAESPGEPRTVAVTARPGEAGYGEQVARRLIAESDDVLAALRFARALPGADARRAAVIGSSYGGINAILAAGRDPDVAACVSFAAAAMTWKHAPEVAALLLDMVARARGSFLFLQAANDFDLTPSEALAARCAEIGRPHERVVFPPFGANEMEGHQIWIHAPHVWSPVVLPYLARALVAPAP